MIKLYTNRELSEKLGINLAKWKRWSREFLPPDPLGGMQSGFARQYYFNDAFNVMLGGHLVGNLNFNVYEAKRILDDLKDWVTEKGFYRDSGEGEDIRFSGIDIKTYKIFITPRNNSDKKQLDFIYTIRGIISNKPIEIHGVKAREELYVETVIGDEGKNSVRVENGYEKILNISSLYKKFLRKLGFKDVDN